MARKVPEILRHTVAIGMPAGEHGGQRRSGGRNRGDRIEEENPLGREAVEGGRGRDRIAVGSQVVRPEGVDGEQEDVRPLFGRAQYQIPREGSRRGCSRGAGIPGTPRFRGGTDPRGGTLLRCFARGGPDCERGLEQKNPEDSAGHGGDGRS